MVGSTFCVLSRLRLTGREPEFRSSTSWMTYSFLKVPSITALSRRIVLFFRGAMLMT